MSTTKENCGCSHPTRHQFHFSVDTEKLVAWSEGDTAELTVREILDMSGNQPAEDFYLVEVGPPKQKYTDLDKVVLIKPNTKFAAACKAPTPVS